VSALAPVGDDPLEVVAARWLRSVGRSSLAAGDAAMGVPLPGEFLGLRDPERLAVLSALRPAIIAELVDHGTEPQWADRLWDLLVWRLAVASESILRDELYELARTDPLTGLLNRRGMTECVEREVARSRRTGLPVAFALLDLDAFKQLNDASGHAAGDGALEEIGRLLRERLRATDVAARWGGDEFAVVLTATPGRVAREVIDRLRATLSHPSYRRRGVPRVTFSAGVASLSGDGADLPRLLRMADSSLYDVKRAGGNGVRLHPSGSARSRTGT
jgi:diguanylate cyclase (GGDEF)-like protein